MVPDNEKLLTAKEAAALYEELSVYMVYKFVKEGRLKGTWFGRKLYVTPSDLHEAIYGKPTSTESTVKTTGRKSRKK